MGRESSHGTKEPFNLPTLVLKDRHLSGSAFCLIDIGLSEQAVGGFPLGLGLVVEDRPSELSCMYFMHRNIQVNKDSIIPELTTYNTRLFLI